MSEPTLATRAGVATAVLAVITAIALGVYRPWVSPEGDHFRVEWDGGAPAGVSCLETTMSGDNAALAFFGLATEDAGNAYLRCRACGLPDPDAGVVAELPRNMQQILAAASELPFDADAGWPMMECWKVGNPAAPSPCRCGSGCQKREDPSQPWKTLRPGEVVGPPYEVTQIGSGPCVPTTCVELAGVPGRPAECWK